MERDNESVKGALRIFISFFTMNTPSSVSESKRVENEAGEEAL